MPEPQLFEARLQTALRRYTDGGPGVDAPALARTVAHTGHAGRRGWGGITLGDQRRVARLALIAAGGLLLVLALGSALIASRRTALVPPSVPVPSVAPSPAPSVAPSADVVLLPPIGPVGPIAYCQGESPDTTVRVMATDGTGDRELVKGTGLAFSADGSRVMYVTGWPDDTKVFVADADGTTARSIPDIGGDGGGQERALSPDGRWIAWFDRRRLEAGSQRTGSIMGFEHPDLRLTPVDGGEARTLMAGDAVADPYVAQPVWAPDGRSIAFAGMQPLDDGGHRTSIWVVDVEGADVRRLTARRGTDAGTIAWSPDSRRIAYSGLPDDMPPPRSGTSDVAVQDLFIIDADGTDERDLSNAVGDEVDPVWSPDGRMLAYLHWAGPTRRVEVTEVDGSAGPVPAGPEAERVSWSPDSTTLLYSTSDTLATVDAAFREEPVVLASDGPIACSSWRPGPP